MNMKIKSGVLIAILICSIPFTVIAEIPKDKDAHKVKANSQSGSPLARQTVKDNDTIVFLGDSITAMGVRPTGYVTLTSQAISKAYPDLTVQVVGAGRGGHKVPDCQKRLDRDVLQMKPTIVLIYIGINDVWHWTHPRVVARGKKGTTPEVFENGLKDMIQKNNRVGARVILCTPTVIGEKPDGSNPQDKMLNEYSEISRKVAKDTGSQLLDLRKAFIAYLKEHNPNNVENGILTSDGVHMNDNGNRLLSTLVLDALNVPTLRYGQAEENLALQATASCKDKSASYVNDGDYATEWDGESRNIWYGWIDYPTLKMQWDTPQRANKIVLHDRPGLDNHTAACTIRFDDGSPVQVYAIPNDGTGKTVVFAPRSFKEMTVQVVDGIGEHIGLSELEVYYDPEAKPETAPRKAYTDPVSYVDPFIETGRGRWFFCTPGSMPFGMISAAPYTRNKNQGGGGYNYNSNEILGFANIHAWIMSGINIMPVTGDVEACAGETAWKSRFSHAGEIMEPGYHKLYLERYQTQVEYTATDRVVFYRLKYDEAAKAKLLLQLGGFVGAASYVDGDVTLVTPTRLEGSHGMTDRLWGGPKLTHVFFVMDIDRPVQQMDAWKGQDRRLVNVAAFSDPVKPERIQKGYFGHLKGRLFENLPEDQAGVSLAYDVKEGDDVLVKIGISYTSIENARKNLEAECDHWDFDRVRADARRTWNEWLGRIEVKGGQEKTRVKFYTDLWHVLLGRHTVSDCNGDYPSYMNRTQGFEWMLKSRGALGYKTPKGQENEVIPLVVRRVPQDKDGEPSFPMFNSDATWLTMWNLNILWGLGWPEVMDDFASSMLEYAEIGGHIPRGPSGGGYSCIMRGCPTTSLITSTWQKGLLTKADENMAYEAMKRSHDLLTRDVGAGEAVQGAFEYWALAQMAEEMGYADDARAFQPWIDKWKKYYDPQKNLLTGKWVEANDWQGTFGVSHDIKGLAKLMGGPDELTKKLNFAFEQSVATDFISTYGEGYVSYGNQPGLSNAHVFNHAGTPWLSQKWVRRVSRQAYGGTNPNIGYGGHDEDQGQMGGVSALMKIGLFSLRGTSSKEPVYEITTPEFDEVTITLDPRYYSGKTFTIKTYNNQPDHMYIQKARLNGKPLGSTWFYHKDFAQGGTLELWLGVQPNKAWGTGKPLKDEG